MLYQSKKFQESMDKTLEEQQIYKGYRYIENNQNAPSVVNDS